MQLADSMSQGDCTDHVKILLDVEVDDGSVEIESVWAMPVARGYRIDSIPFYAKGVACNDTVSVEKDAGGMLRATGVVVASGHSTVRLWFEKEADVARVRDELRAMGCPSELDLSRLVAVDVPPSTPYDRVRAYLDRQEVAGVFEYEEGCLGQGSETRVDDPYTQS